MLTVSYLGLALAEGLAVQHRKVEARCYAESLQAIPQLRYLVLTAFWAEENDALGARIGEQWPELPTTVHTLNQPAEDIAVLAFVLPVCAACAKLARKLTAAGKCACLLRAALSTVSAAPVVCALNPAIFPAIGALLRLPCIVRTVPPLACIAALAAVAILRYAFAPVCGTRPNGLALMPDAVM
jgi:hypothetical protein